MVHHPPSKTGLHPALPVLVVFIGTVIVSIVFGMMLFPVFTEVCANTLLLGAAKFGYGGVAVLLIGLLLEAYNLFEHHRHHVSWLVIISIIMSLAAASLLYVVASTYTC